MSDFLDVRVKRVRILHICGCELKGVLFEIEPYLTERFRKTLKGFAR